MDATHQQLLWLTYRRASFRVGRALNRMKSPRRILASTIAVLFFSLYVLNGFFILASRRAADPRSLGLWLSGGMVLYLIYHCVRCVWTRKQADMEFTEAEQLWLGGAPLHRSTVAGYKVNSVLFSALLKTFFLVVVLAPDTTRIGMLAIGIFAALVLLEIIRMVWQRFVSGLGERSRQLARVSLTAVAIAAFIQFATHLVSITPAGSEPGIYLLNSFPALGQLASCDCIQWLATPWRAAALLATTTQITSHSGVQLAASILLVPTAIIALVRVDAWAKSARLSRERQRYADGDYRAASTSDGLKIEFTRDALADRIESLIPFGLRDSAAMIWRQALSVHRYLGTILFSFLVPTVLCLSPLLTGRIGNQWAFVIGGIVLCTMLLAPPALRIDFRRDLKRMLLLRSLPLRPVEAVLGQLTLPIIITIAFQWVTLAIAGAVVMPGWSQIIVWGGMLSALAVFTFATENALFLAYPHHENAQGFAMVVRANVMFLGKATLMAVSMFVLAIWVGFCKTAFAGPFETPAYVLGAVSMTWLLALGALFGTAWCWQRFDVAADLPPE
ncbi:MAG: hypothetical protein AAFX06_01875 [Planctomycetota bacterium]